MDTGDVRFDYGLEVDVDTVAEGMLGMVRLDSDIVALKAGMLPARLISIMRAALLDRVRVLLPYIPEEERMRLVRQEVNRISVRMLELAKARGLVAV